jgi:hypothetical protein
MTAPGTGLLALSELGRSRHVDLCDDHWRAIEIDSTAGG